MFLKIFLWFWLATAIIVGTEILVGWATRNEPLPQIFRSPAEHLTAVYADSAAEIYELGGQAAVCRQLERIENRVRRKSVIFAASGEEICRAGNWNTEPNDTAKAAELAAGLNEKQNSVVNFTPNGVWAARTVELKNGDRFALIVQLPPPRLFFVSWETRAVRILTVLLTAGLVCYALARYLTSPLRKLREATKQFAGGDLAVRVAPRIGKRRDEISSLARDFDEMAERIENLVAAQKNLTTDISHELRSPLARLGVALEIARTKTNADAQPALDRIERESARLNEMISQMLLLSRLESGMEDIEKARVDLSKIVAEVAADADFEAGSQNKSVKFTAGEKIFVRGEARLLQSAIENVVRNAVKYAASTVEITLEKRGEKVLVSVRDDGAGVPAEDLPNLFRPFYRVGFARERNAGGFGLGLAITERAAQAHRGKITAENSGVGGLQVKIELPIEN